MKKMTALVLALLLVLSASACGGSGSQPANSDQPAKTDSTTPPADAKKEKITLVIGAGHTAGSMEYIDSLDNFFKPEVAKRVAENTNYEIEWTDAYGTVVGVSETVTGTQDGLLDFCVITTSPVSGQLPYHQYSIYLPFCTGDNALLQKVSNQLYEEFSDELVTSFETQYNQKLLAKLVLDSYEIFSSAPIEKFSDLNAKKIGGSGRNLLWLENTGAVAVQSNMTDGYTSLQTGLISGQFAAPHWAVKANYQDICKYATDIGLDSTMGELLTVNLTKWNSLPAEVQEIILQVSKELEEYHLQYTNDCRAKAYEAFEAAGGTIVKMSEEEKAAWLAALPNIPDTATELGPTGLKILSRYVELLKENGVAIPRDWTFNY
nr:TRAP transporter substrate-binding protein DctP [uncultured Oscillibacter sp.]